MERIIDWDKETDGRFYTIEDLAKLGCNDCEGCSECCRFSADTIVLDPYDIYQLEGKTGMSFQNLLGAGKIGLRVVDGVILPHLSVLEEGGCTFLDEEGRCSIHDARPGFCRLFPLGRKYEDGSFRYFLQTNECVKSNRTKIRIRNWLGVPDPVKYEKFIADWHYFLKPIQEKALAGMEQSDLQQISMYLLQMFYLTDYRTDLPFEKQFERRFGAAREALKSFLNR